MLINADGCKKILVLSLASIFKLANNSGLDFDPHSILDYQCTAIYVQFHRNETELVYST